MIHKGINYINKNLYKALKRKFKVLQNVYSTQEHLKFSSQYEISSKNY